MTRYLPWVLEIEALSFEFPWTEEDFNEQLQRDECTAFVAVHVDTPIGYAVYDLHKKHIELLSFAVHPRNRRMGVGSQMISILFDKLSLNRFNRITLEVRESNLDAQLFFRENGFLAIDALKDRYDVTGEDSYVMEHRIQKSVIDSCVKL